MPKIKILWEENIQQNLQNLLVNKNNKTPAKEMRLVIAQQKIKPRPKYH